MSDYGNKLVKALEECAALTLERDQLAARAAELEALCVSMNNLWYPYVYASITIDRDAKTLAATYQKVIVRTDAQSINSIKAQALDEVGVKCVRYSTGELFGEKVYGLPILKLSDIVEEANKLRSEGKDHD